MKKKTTITRIAFFGAAPDTPNMGVSALFMSALAGVSRHIDPVEFVVFDNGFGLRQSILEVPGGKRINILLYGARGGKRYHRPENLATMHFASRLGALGAYLNEGVRLIDSCHAVLDVSGGDSFSDIYGRNRFDNIFRPKAIAINRGKPLILLPQTYGPFNDPAVQKLAASVVSKAAMAWARDTHSYQILISLLGKAYDPKRHLCGVDMAFGLLPSNAEQMLDEKIKSLISSKDPARPVIGFNVSGLIYNDPAGASAKYGLKADYKQAVNGFISRILQETTASIILISHVMDQPGHYESDLAACHDVWGQFKGDYAGRISVAPASLDQSQVKWLISKMDWFCGTRMHSTIAGLSSGVPTASISYSDKTLGVFDSCGLGEAVIDPRCNSAPQISNFLFKAYEDRERLQNILALNLPTVMDHARKQMQDLSSFIEAINH